MWTVVVHGGARTIAPADEDTNRAGVTAAAQAAARLLQMEGAAIDACEEAVRVLEDDEAFNAGAGAVLNEDGEAALDAALMDGATLDIGAVGALTGFRYPVRAARALLREETVLLVGTGASRFATMSGLERALPIPPARGDSGHDTVGAIVRDAMGNFAAGVSTGGLAHTRVGRIGDAPLPGCGFYADNKLGAVCFSGDGERIARTILAARVMNALEHGASAQVAAEAAILQLKRVGGEAGVIVLDKNGAPGWAHNSSHFAVAIQSMGQAPVATVKR